MKELFVELNRKEIPYIVWKDIHKTESFFQGNAELDLLVSEDCKLGFEELINLYGFSKLKVNPKLQRKGIEHYIKFYNDKYYHLHVYYQLRTGNHFVKEYLFNFGNDIFEKHILRNNIKIVNDDYEYSLLLVRLIIKRTALFSTLKTSEIKRLIALNNDVNKVSVLESLKKLGLTNKVNLDDLFNVAAGKEESSAKIKAVRSLFEHNKTLTTFQLYYQYVKIRKYYLFLRVKRQSNKVMCNKGLTIAVMGTDGSGKTSIVQQLVTLFKKKTSSRTLYLGGNSKTYSFETRCYYVLYWFFRVFSPLKDRFYIPWLFYYFAVCVLEYGKARDRINRISKGNKYKEKGWIVIFERFPIVGLFDFPQTLVNLQTDKWQSYKSTKVINVLLKKITTMVNSIKEPDILFLITTDFEKMKGRRELADNEIKDIKRKIDVQNAFLAGSNRDIKLLDNNGSFQEVIGKMIHQINSELCRYN